MMLPPRLRVGLGELDPVAFDPVHGADELTIGPDDPHVLADIGLLHGVSFCRE
jgi:hypothetical protein